MAISFTKFFAIPLMLTMCSTICRCGSSSVFHYPAVFNFGDSNSDTGELLAGKGFRLPLPYGETYFQSPSSGRFCNGRLIVDFLSKLLDCSSILLFQFLFQSVFLQCFELYLFLLLIFFFFFVKKKKNHFRLNILKFLILY